MENAHNPLGNKTIWAVLVIGAIFTTIQLFIHLNNHTEFVYLKHTLFIPIILSAFLYQIYGGLISGIFSGIIILLTVKLNLATIENMWYYIFSYILIGIFVGGLFSYLSYQNQRIKNINERRLRELYSALGEGIYVIDEQGKLIFLNSEAEQILGWKEEELKGKFIHDLIHYENIDGIPIPSAECPIIKNIRTGGMYQSDEDTFIHKNGTKIPVSYKSTAISIDEEFTGYITAFQDISSHKKTEKSLQKTFNELERFKIALDHHAIVSITDRSGVIIYANDKFCEVSQYSREELIGKTHRLVNSEIHSKDYFKDFWETISRGEIWKGELVNRKKDGSLYWLEATVVPFINEKGEPYQFIAVRYDITNRIMMEKSLQKAKEDAEQANRAKSEFLSRMSHELRTPLNAILGFGQLMESDPYEPLTESQLENVKEILKAGQHLLTLINEILDLSRIEAGKLTLSLESVKVQNVINASYTLIQPMAEKYKVKVEDCPADNEFYVIADKTRLQQVMLNLLSNAIKYNFETGKVKISCNQVSNHYLRISVIDTGHGIPEDRQEELFKPFNRLGVEETGIEGTGIGLNLSKRLIELMNGRINFDSELGKGSHFYIDLPLAEKSLIEEREIKDTDLVTRVYEEKKKTLIYIEDNSVNVQLVSRILSRRPNITFIFAATANLGLDLILSHQPDLILLDINLPDMDGYAVLKHLKENDLTKEIPVIALSANAMSNDINKGLSAGFSHYLTKPIQVKDFLKTIDQILQSPKQIR